MSTKNYQNNSTFIIPTYSNTIGLISVLRLLKKYNENSTIVVVNNNRKNDLNKILPLKELSRGLLILDQKKNTGFAKACNDGAKKAKEIFKSEYLIFLNDDVTFETNFLDLCVEELISKRWVATSPVLMKNHIEIENCGYKVLSYGKIQLVTNISTNEKIDGLSATSLVFKSDPFFKLSGFDEKFFAYLEDIDLFLRAKRLAMKFGVCKKVKVFHKGQETSSRMSVKKSYLDFKNWILLISKNWSREEIVKNLPEIIIERGKNFWGIIKAIIN